MWGIVVDAVGKELWGEGEGGWQALGKCVSRTAAVKIYLFNIQRNR